MVMEVKRAERWETLVWVGIAVAALALMVMSFAGRESPPPPRQGPRGETRVGRYGSKNQFVANAVDGQQMFGSVPVVAEFFSQLNDDLIEGARGTEVIVAPYVV